MTLPEIKPNLKNALARWAEARALRPSDFARAMDYTPAYGWSLLRGQAEVTPEAFGRFVLAYGTDAAAEVLALAGLTTETMPRPEGAQVVPVVSISDDDNLIGDLVPVAA